MRLRHAFQRLAIRPRKSHGGISGNACSQALSLEQRKFSEAAFDALVDVSQTFFEPQDFLPDHREAEVAGLDDARVNRTDRDFVHAVALHGHEGVVVGDG